MMPIIGETGRKVYGNYLIPLSISNLKLIEISLIIRNKWKINIHIDMGMAVDKAKEKGRFY